MSNQLSRHLFAEALSHVEKLGCRSAQISGAQVLDAGVNCRGSLAAGLLLARLCLGDRAEVSLLPSDFASLCSHQTVFVRTDDPLVACLGCQYAGWPVQSEDYFAMGSGPMRMVRGREPVLQSLGLTEPAQPVSGVLESDKLPTTSTIAPIASQCQVSPQDLHLAIAPSTSLAGSVQVVARSIETAMHKLHELHFDVRTIVSATGNAPLPPPAKLGDTVQGIGRTNDAMLYGATVTLWVDHDDEAIESVIERVPSCSSGDFGQPFAKVFKQYQYDFYKVDPLLFSPAVVTIHSLRSGRTWTAGRIESEILRQSFLA
jgi:methenyltetrahydromethanopterin cyclohydrolase